jgi:glycine/D-amino acid oxidase-like deaminating enzyme
VQNSNSISKCSVFSSKFAANYNKHLKVDCLISGGGIAGITLALECIQMGKTVCLIDSNVFNGASKTAAGLINPIVPKRVIPGWLAEDIYPAILPYYRKLETLLDAEFYHAYPLVQIHKTAEEQRIWQRQSLKPDLQMFLQVGKDALPIQIQVPYGYSQILHTGRLDTLKYLEAGRHYIQGHGAFLQEEFEYGQLSHSQGQWHYKEIESEVVVFCEGTGIQQNPYFSWIPVKGTAGDIVSVRFAGLPDNMIYKQKHWLVPDCKGSFYAGSNFIHEPALSQVTDDVQEILEHLKTWSGEVHLQDSKRAQRPVISDRRPILGEHPTHKGLFVFNGLGTKGCSLVTRFAPEMAMHIWHKAPVHKEVNSDRFLAFYAPQ